MKSTKPWFSFSSTSTLLDVILDLDYFHEDGDEPPAIPFHRVDGEGKVVVIVGDNASGKSFCRRIVQAVCQKAQVECIPISVEGRRKVSYMPWLSMVYGDEEYEATGVNSTHTVLSGITTSKGRETPHIIFWDEPDLGLSEGWAAGVGQKFCAFAQDPPEHLRAAFIVSHSRALIREMLPAKPFYLHLGVSAEEAPQTIQDWVERPVSPRDPEKLPEMSRQRFKKIQRILGKVKP